MDGVMKKIIVLLVLIVVSFLLWLATLSYPEFRHLEKGFQTSLALAITYLLFRLVLEGIVAKRIREAKTRYSLRKTVSILYLVAFVVIVMGIWAKSSQMLVVSYGLVAAGVAVALQDFFKNFVGGIILFVNGNYRVGDRIEINSKCGDVIDIGILYSTLMEMKEWVTGDQATGRLSIIPNGLVLSSAVNNYTKDNDFVWDEMTVPIAYESDWKAAIEKFHEIVRRETEDIAIQAEKAISGLDEKLSDLMFPRVSGIAITVLPPCI